MDSVDLLDVVKVIEAFLGRFEPHTVYTHWPFDLNIDHRIVSEAVQDCMPPSPSIAAGSNTFFEVPSSTEWRVKCR